MAPIAVPPPRGLEAAFSSFAAPSMGNRNQSKSSNVRVVVRIRPINQDETAKGCAVAVEPTLPPSEVPSSPARSSSTKRVFGMSLRRPESPRDQSPTRRRPFAFLTPRRSKEVGHPGTPPRHPLPTHSSTPIMGVNGQRLFAASPNGPSNTEQQTYGTAQSLTAQQKQFDFDAVFAPEATQKEVYDRSVGDAVRRNIFRGYNTTIIAYGQTGSGKTYTMGGRRDAELAAQAEKSSPTSRDTLTKSFTFDSVADSASIQHSNSFAVEDDDGIIKRAVHDLFKAKQRHESAGEVTVQLTYLEIYNDELRDMMVGNGEFSSNLKLRDQGDDGVIVSDLTTVTVSSAAQVIELMDAAASRRVTTSTRMNMRSSRSHAICTLHVTINPATSANAAASSSRAEVINAKLTLVDLAGSERIKETGVAGVQQQESININKDLFVLGKVVSALAEKTNKKGSAASKVHVPYRDSKLTRLLRDSLGGNCCTVMVACISPADMNVEESINTLRYAERTRAITNSIKQNVLKAVMTPAECAAMRGENKMLKVQVAELKRRLSQMESRSKADENVSIDSSDTVENTSPNTSIDGHLTGDSPMSLHRLPRREPGPENVEQKSVLCQEVDKSQGNANGSAQSGEKVSESLVASHNDDSGKEKRSRDYLECESLALKMENRSLQSENSQLIITIATHRKEISGLNEQVVKQKIAMAATESEAIQRKDELKHEIVELEGRMESLRYESARMQERIQLLSYEHADLKADSRGHPWSSTLRKHRKPESNFSIELAPIRKPISSVSEQEKEINLRQALTYALQGNERLLEELNEIKRERASIVNQQDDTSQQISELLVQVRAGEELRKELEVDLARAEGELEIMKEERDTLQIKVAAHEDTIHKLHEELTKMEETHSTEVERLQTALSCAETAKDELEKEAEEKENSIIQLATSNSRDKRDENANDERAQIQRGVLCERNRIETTERDDPKISRQGTKENPVADDNASNSHDTGSCRSAGPETDDSTVDDTSAKSNHKAIRIHAAKMLFWANKAIERNRSSNSVCSSIATSNGSEFLPNLKDLQSASFQAAPIPQTITAATPGKPPRQKHADRSLRPLSGMNKDVMISNIDQMKDVTACSCQNSLFSGNEEHVQFYLPKLGMACSCGKQQPDRANLSDAEDPMDVKNILRPWQVEFLNSLHIHTGEELVHAYNKRGAAMAKEMRKWRKEKKLVSVKTKSCSIALHIWSRTCKAVVRSVRQQRAKGATVLKTPAFLEVSIPSDSRTVSTIGDSSLIVHGSQVEM